MANEGHIIIKKSGEQVAPQKGRYGTSQFYKPVDKGSSKPAFCYPRRADALKREYRTMEKNLDMGHITPERKMAYAQKMKQLGNRIGEIDESFNNAKEIIESNKDGWKSRRDNLAEKISELTPTRDDVMKRRVNPHSVLRREKSGEKGSQPLEKMKREYTVISRAFQAAGEHEEANHSFLQKDK